MSGCIEQKKSKLYSLELIKTNATITLKRYYYVASSRLPKCAPGFWGSPFHSGRQFTLRSLKQWTEHKTIAQTVTLIRCFILFLGVLFAVQLRFKANSTANKLAKNRMDHLIRVKKHSKCDLFVRLQLMFSQLVIHIMLLPTSEISHQKYNTCVTLRL